MKKAAIVFWNFLTVLMILILLLGSVYFKLLSNIFALIVFGLIITGIYIFPILFDKQKRRKILIIENLIVNGIFLFVFVFLIITSPGIPKQFTDQNNDRLEKSISEWDKVSIVTGSWACIICWHNYSE
jgi:uncharacterized protein YacL